MLRKKTDISGGCPQERTWDEGLAFIRIMTFTKAKSGGQARPAVLRTGSLPLRHCTNITKDILSNLVRTVILQLINRFNKNMTGKQAAPSNPDVLELQATHIFQKKYKKL